MTSAAAHPDDRIGAVQHVAIQTWCHERHRPAVLNVVQRGDAVGIRFVLWCSLRACGECSEQCLTRAAGEPD